MIATEKLITWDQIPGWFDFQDIYDDAVRDAPDGSTFVEVGCMLGRSTFYLAQKIKESGKKIKLYAVDHWQGDFEQTLDDRGIINYAKEHGSFYNAFLYNLYHSGLSDIVHVVRANSAQAWALFEDPFLVFLDASHDYDSMQFDLKNWSLIGTTRLAGHDYTGMFLGVVQAVDEYRDNTGARLAVRGNSWELHWND